MVVSCFGRTMVACAGRSVVGERLTYGAQVGGLHGKFHRGSLRAAMPELKSMRNAYLGKDQACYHSFVRNR
jgi:hypothetical protein